MKRVDVWETIAAVAMHVERARVEGLIPQSELGAYSVAETLAHMNSLAATLHRVATERANGFPTPAKRSKAERTESQAVASLEVHAKRLCLTVEIQEMGHVELTAGPRRLGLLPMAN